MVPIDVVGVDVLDVRAVERGRHRPDVAQRLGDRLDVLAGVEHTGPLARRRRRRRGTGPTRRTRCRRASASGTKSLISGLRLSVRLPRRIVPICVSEPIGSRQAPLGQLDAGDEGRGDGAEADGEDAEAAVGGLHVGRRCRRVRCFCRTWRRRLWPRPR